jgi:ribonuclease T2
LIHGANLSQWLADAGITPSTSKTYTAAEIGAALSKTRGVDVAIMCKNSEFDEAWYFYNVQGSVQTGNFKPTNPDGSKSTCPSTGIKYLPKGGSGGGGTTTAQPTSGPTTSPPSPTGTAWAGKGTLAVSSNGSVKGGLISTGKWMVGSTPATVTASQSGSGFTLTTSKGPCAVVSGAFTCASGNKAEVFTSEDGSLASGGSADFFADSVPSGTTQVAIKTASGANAVEIVWKS